MTKRVALTYDVIIVGAGPAGLCAALYAGRGLLKAVTIERGAPGGELLNTDLIEDYIGFESVKGWDLAQKMTEHAKKFGAEIVTDTVERIRRGADGWFDVETARGETYRSQAVILTAGGTPVKLGVPGEKEYAGKGVSYCAVCDGAFFKGEHLAVVGGGDAAVEEADYLTRYASKVTLVHRRDEFRAAPDTVKKMRALVAAGEMDLVIGQVMALQGEGGMLAGATVKLSDGGTATIACDALLPFFGLTMRLGPVTGWGLQLEGDLIPVDTAKFETNIPGLFAIGDINTYPGKLKLILSGFHEAALMAQQAYRYVYPEQRLVFQYTTSSTSLQKKLGAA